LEIPWQVTKDVDQLEALSKTNSVRQHRHLIDRSCGKEVETANFRPEFADATGHAVSVVIQFVVGLKRDDMSGTRATKPVQVQFLPTSDGGHDAFDQLLVRELQPAEGGYRLIYPLEQQAFGGGGLVLSKFAKLKPFSPARG
jgi:hypothetical protein